MSLNTDKEKTEYLALTADTELWDPGKEIVMLGDWCIADFNRDILKGIKYTILEEKDRAADFCGDQEYLEKLGKRVAASLAKSLNELHHTNHTEAYWSFLLREWVIEYLKQWYKCYNDLLNAKDHFDTAVTCVYGTDEETYPFPLFDIQSFRYDNVNLLDFCMLSIYKRIIEEIGDHYGIEAEYRDKEIKRTPVPVNEKTGKPGIKDRIYGFINRKADIMIFNTIMGDDPGRLKLKMLGKTFFTYGSGDSSLIGRHRRDLSLRKSIHFDIRPENEFETVIGKNMINDLPLGVVEAYEDVCRYNEKICKHVPKAVMIWGGKVTSEKIRAAGLKEKGAKIYGFAHSPIPSVFRYSHEEEDDCDVFYCWGKPVNSRQRTAPSFKYYKRVADSVKREKIRWFTDPCRSNFRYAGKSRPVFGSAVNDRYWELTEEFISGCDQRVLNEIIYRQRDLSDYGIRHKIEDLCPEISFDDRLGQTAGQSYGGLISELIYDSRLVICESITTSVFYETIVRGIPVMVLYYLSYDLCKRSGFLSDMALDAYGKLKDAGIIFNDGKKAAEFVNNCRDFDKWWNEPERKRVIKEVTDDFIFHTDDSCSWWEKELAGICKGNG
ncbi:MAG: hypothetical protein K5886_08595 [Lachnospiraceae bacterium]|nr:hypothetical protein [Lachnospiraceae bacterium]